MTAVFRSAKVREGGNPGTLCVLRAVPIRLSFPHSRCWSSIMKIPTAMNWKTALTAFLAVMLITSTRATPAATPADTLPSQISDVEFWRFVTEFSEANGPYPYENYVGNEVMLQRVIPAARKETRLGGVYI